MFDFDDLHNAWTPFTDLMASILAVFLVAAVLMALHLVDPKKDQKKADIKSPGTVMVETFWKNDVDVDTWVQSPDDKPVGYSRKEGKYFDLLRDDLGRPGERDAGMHHENVFSRNAPAGEYVINIHMYSNYTASAFPIEVEVDVDVTKNADGKSEPKTVIHTKIELDHLNEEVTVVRFTLDDHANIVPGSINHDQIPLREAK